MIISKKTKHTQKTVKVPSMRINKNGHIVFNKAAVQLLEIEDNEKEGVVFGYQNNEPYVAYSTDEDCYKGMFKVGETSFRFGSKDLGVWRGEIKVDLSDAGKLYDFLIEK